MIIELVVQIEANSFAAAKDIAESVGFEVVDGDILEDDEDAVEDEKEAIEKDDELA